MRADTLTEENRTDDSNSWDERIEIIIGDEPTRQNTISEGVAAKRCHETLWSLQKTVRKIALKKEDYLKFTKTIKR